MTFSFHPPLSSGLKLATNEQQRKKLKQSAAKSYCDEVNVSFDHPLVQILLIYVLALVALELLRCIVGM